MEQLERLILCQLLMRHLQECGGVLIGRNLQKTPNLAVGTLPDGKPAQDLLGIGIAKFGTLLLQKSLERGKHFGCGLSFC